MLRVLLLEESSQAKKTKAHLVEKGFDVKACDDLDLARHKMTEWGPDFFVADQSKIQDVEDFTVWLKNHYSEVNRPKIIVLAAHSTSENIRRLVQVKVDGYLIKPFKYSDLAERLLFLAQKKMHFDLGDGETSSASSLDLNLMPLHLTELVLQEALTVRPLERTLFNLCQMAALKMNAVRVSIMACDLEKMTGQVLGSSDDPEARKISVDLNKYPEVSHVLMTDKVAAIDNFSLNGSLKDLIQNAKTIQFNSMIVCPIYTNGVLSGVLSLRLNKDFKGLKEEDIRFARIVSFVVSLVLSRHVAALDFPKMTA